jgi:phenazine biosynthesis protein phzE
MTALLSRILSSGGAMPFAVLRREELADVDVLTGDVVDVDTLADIPLDGRTVLALVPYRQVRERGYQAFDDGAPLRCLIVREREAVPVDAALELLPAEPVAVESLGFDVPDDEYAGIVRHVIDEEIGRGEGANFVIARSFRARTDAPPVDALLSWFRALLTGESGAYWTFAVHAPGAGAAVSMVGATPERHLTVRGGAAMMNPISGTYRHPEGGPTRDGVLAFLADVKESEELFMVVDEEMKMMSALCPGGGRILGPYLKQMSRLTHTEYLLEGRTELDVRDALGLTMFAPTVTGSPMQNACRVIARHETRPRGYYSGVLALFEPEAGGDGADEETDTGADADAASCGTVPDAARPLGYSLDAPILIRTARLHEDGRLAVTAGATLVRHSTPEGEVAETHAKASGMLAALGLRPRGAIVAAPVLAAEPGVAEALASRNDQLAAFWVRMRADAPDPEEAGRSALIVDHEDRFTTMLAHQLRSLGFVVRVVPWQHVDEVRSDDLVVFGPGPGDPRDLSDRRVARLRALLLERARAGLPLLAVCLSHQVLAQLAGLSVEPLPAPHQGVRREVDVFGRRAAIGFYNTYAAMQGDVGSYTELDLEACADETGAVTALRGPGIASIQGHLESVLSADGLVTLSRLVDLAFAGAPGASPGALPAPNAHSAFLGDTPRGGRDTPESAMECRMSVRGG